MAIERISKDKEKSVEQKKDIVMCRIPVEVYELWLADKKVLEESRNLKNITLPDYLRERFLK